MPVFTPNDASQLEGKLCMDLFHKWTAETKLRCVPFDELSPGVSDLFTRNPHIADALDFSVRDVIAGIGGSGNEGVETAGIVFGVLLQWWSDKHFKAVGDQDAVAAH